jgi:hypothetical protein
MAQAKPKRKAKAVKKAVKARPQRLAKKAAPRRRRAAKPSLAKEFGDLADKLSSIGRTVFEQGTERAGEVARAGITAFGQGREKIASEIAAIKRAALTRAKR